MRRSQTSRTPMLYLFTGLALGLSFFSPTGPSYSQIQIEDHRVWTDFRRELLGSEFDSIQTEVQILPTHHYSELKHHYNRYIKTSEQMNVTRDNPWVKVELKKIGISFDTALYQYKYKDKVFESSTLNDALDRYFSAYEESKRRLEFVYERRRIALERFFMINRLYDSTKIRDIHYQAAKQIPDWYWKETAQDPTIRLADIAKLLNRPSIDPEFRLDTQKLRLYKSILLPEIEKMNQSVPAEIPGLAKETASLAKCFKNLQSQYGIDKPGLSSDEILAGSDHLLAVLGRQDGKNDAYQEREKPADGLFVFHLETKEVQFVPLFKPLKHSATEAKASNHRTTLEFKDGPVEFAFYYWHYPGVPPAVGNPKKVVGKHYFGPAIEVQSEDARPFAAAMALLANIKTFGEYFNKRVYESKDVANSRLTRAADRVIDVLLECDAKIQNAEASNQIDQIREELKNNLGSDNR